MQIDYSVPGYEVIGQMDFSVEAADRDAVALLVWDSQLGLGILWADGCSCCCDMQDGIVPSEVRIVEDMMELAQELYDAAAYADDEDAVDDVRESLRAAQARMAPRAPLELM